MPPCHKSNKIYSFKVLQVKDLSRCNKWKTKLRCQLVHLLSQRRNLMESRLKSKRASPRAKLNRRLRLKLMPTISTHQSSMKKCSWMMMRETHLCRKPVGLGSDRMSMRQQYHKSIITTLLMPLNKSKNLKMISLISFI